MTKSSSSSQHHLSTFIRAGQRPSAASRTSSSGLLSTAQDWELKLDVWKQLKLTENVAATTSRPDMVLLSEASKQVILLELAIPWEDRIEEANQKKRVKYAELVEQCRSE
ncbi:hypothetical protein N1851_020577 [Merluccius polli]|uniref:Uncharacterized protein n=1 Tax=Merluccius polli TaxID=89951 RepID=A0AA47NYR1_MERPO|nr:hypothetical protein N1851_020577 [Merluccius polli]